MSLAIKQSSQALLSCMEQVMMEWAFLSLDYLGEPGQKPARLPLERRIRLQGPQSRACMVVRGSFGLGLGVARSVRGLPSSNLPAGEASFVELCGLIAEEWRRREQAMGQGDWSCGKVEASNPDQWPTGPADAAVVATVRGLAIEVLLWSEAQGGSQALRATA